MFVGCIMLSSSNFKYYLCPRKFSDDPSEYPITDGAISKLLEMFHGNLKWPENLGMGLSKCSEPRRRLPWNLPCFWLRQGAQGVTLSVCLSGTSLSKAMNLHLSLSGLSQVSLSSLRTDEAQNISSC